MNLRISSLLLLLLLTLAAQGQQLAIHNQTTPPANARFEIVQSQNAAKWTFRLDRFSGHIWQLVRTHTGGNSWERMRVIDAPEASASGRPRFQLFLSGLAAKHTFLIDTDSGLTWTVTTLLDAADKETEIVWQPFEK
jgi:hypothetical protein